MADPWTRRVEIGPHVLYQGDALAILPHLEGVCAVLTDPPYGIADKWQGGKGHGWGNQARMTQARNQWDAKPIDAAACALLLAAAPRVIVWGGNYFPLPQSGSWLVWRKEANPGFTMAEAELAWTNLNKPMRVFDHPRNKLTGANANLHPAQKPVPLLRWCLGFVPKAQVILDPYAGSGTTGVACIREGRRFIGIEVHPGHFDTAVRRVSEAYAQPDLLIAPPPPAPVQEVLL